MFEFVCDVMPVAVGEQADLLCAAVLAQSNKIFASDANTQKPAKILLTVHVADDMGAEATLKLHDSAGGAQKTARMGITTTDSNTPADHSEKLAKLLLDNLK